MPVLIQARANRATGWVQLRFPYNEKAKDAIKAHPGARWSPDDKSWFVPTDLLPSLQRQTDLFKLNLSWEEDAPAPALPEVLAARLKPYQIAGAKECVSRPGYLLTFEPRTGKTISAISAACALMEADKIDLAVVLYPNSVVGEWERQLQEWIGASLVRLQSLDPLLTMEVNKLRETPWLFLGCHYEILSGREKCIARIVNGRRYALIFDEVQFCKNRKSGRYQTGRRLAQGAPILVEGDIPETDVKAEATCVTRIGLTGTEMRNRPRDLFGPLDLINPGSIGGYWKFAKKFCDARQENGHWNDKGSSNQAELRERLQQVSMKVTRAEAAPWLPRIDRKVVLCAVPEVALERYRKIEKAYGARIKNALEDDSPRQDDRTMLEEMTRETSRAKMDAAIAECLQHLDREVKVRISGHHHDTMLMFAERFKNYFDSDHPLNQYPHFIAGGWLEQPERQEAIKRWKEVSGPALLITNNLSTSVGIDLSDGKTSISIEPEWVPSDLEQWESRAMDVYHGRTVEPPLVIYLLARGTIDEAIISANLSKLRAIEEIVGKGTETGAMAATFRESGVVSSDRLGLPNTDKETVRLALASLRERLLKGPSKSEVSLEAEMAGWEDDPAEENGSEDEIPF